MARGLIRSVTGNIEAAKPDLDRALDLCRAPESSAHHAMAHYALSLRNTWTGRFTDAIALAEQGVAIARTHANIW